jgi:hypothetical protein
MEWEAFFREHKDYVVETYFYECRGSFSLEDLYCAFKARMEYERQMDEEP